ncbi:MAG: S8 family serine peptidase, partial [Candidatus Eremiobacteraeota bacterium]|nr:S8 family serine peptidase [Candidatus Eremiobacteraeota bacterium]
MQVSSRGPRLPIIVDTAGRAESFASALDEDSHVTHDLSLIGATALEATPECIGRLSLAGFHIYEDQEVEVPAEDSQVEPELDVAAPTVGADRLWKAGIAGQGVTVAVIDTGIAPHDDLGSRLLAFEDLVNHRDKPYDDHGHGTHVAGIVGG